MTHLDAGADDLGQTSCLLLVGGLGTRLRPVVADRGKPMAEIADRPFIDYLVEWVHAQGIRRVTLCAGYKAQDLVDYFGSGTRWPLEITYSLEKRPLGTWGAIRHARRVADLTHPFLVLNGDSWLDADLGVLLRQHRHHNALAALSLAHVDDTARFGRVMTDGYGRVREFTEKGLAGAGWINGGIYAFDPAIFEQAQAAPGSLERDVLPLLLGEPVYGLPVDGPFLDIGTPDDYLRLHHSPGAWLQALRGARGAAALGPAPTIGTSGRATAC